MSDSNHEGDFDPYSLIPDPEFYWCLHCNRTYREKEIRMIGSRRVCAYEDCDAGVLGDGWDWETVRDNHPEYPEIPEPGKMYDLF